MNEPDLHRLSFVHVYTVRLLNYKTHVKFLHIPCTAEAPAVSLKPQATPVFPVITTIVICCLFCRFHFLEGTGTRTGWLPAYLGESDSANCASYTTEHKVQKIFLRDTSTRSKSSFSDLISVTNKVTLNIDTVSGLAQWSP